MLVLERQKFLVDSVLFNNKVLSSVDFYEKEIGLLSKTLNSFHNKTAILNNALQENELFSTINELSHQKALDKLDIESKIFQSVKELKSAIQSWEHQYLIKSSVAGRSSFFAFWKAKQYVHANDVLLGITPPIEQYVCRAYVPTQGVGKIRRGQKVMIKISAFPYEEFGFFIGEVRGISNAPLDSQYSVEVELRNGLTTTRDFHLPNHALHEGVGEIITSDKSLLVRLFEKLFFLHDQYIM